MKTSDAGLHLMHKFEGFRNRPYLCPAHIWTVGWGTVIYQDQIRLPMVRIEGKEVLMTRKEYPLRSEDNRVWPKEELVAMFKNDLAGFERSVLRLVPGVSGHQGRFFQVLFLIYYFLTTEIWHLQNSLDLVLLIYRFYYLLCIRMYCYILFLL